VHDLKDNKTEMRSFNHFVLDRHPSIKVAPNAKSKTIRSHHLHVYLLSLLQL
jgi:hypothetical protein